MAHGRRGPAAPAAGAAARGAHRHDRAAHAGAPPDRRRRPDLPLRGVRVLDLTAWWAGPIAAGVLAALGADVIHVESVSRIDGMRTTGAQHGDGGRVVGAQRALPRARTPTSATSPSTSAPRPGSALLRRLIAESDAVLENFSPRVLGNFGLDWEQIHALNPRCLLVRMPAFGLSGPWRDNVGFAQTMEQVTGLAWITGHRRRPAPHPARARATRTPACTRRSRCIVGLAEREATGRGCLLEVTMVEGALNAAAELVLEATAYGNLLERDGNRSPHVAPQGLYRGRDAGDVAGGVGRDRRRSGGVSVDALGAPAWATRSRASP